MIADQTEMMIYENHSRMGIRLDIVHTKEIDEWIAKHHYLKSAPAISMIRMVFKDRQNRLIGAMLWNKPTARKSDQENILELSRMYFIDDTERMVESHCLGMARKYIRKHFPHIKGIQGFSSTGQGHDGTVYKADGWFVVQITKISKSTKWASREGRTDRDSSDKIKWVRTP